jgi:hypothetical protein
MIATFPNNAQSDQDKIGTVQISRTDTVSIFLRAEGLVELILAVWGYHYLGGAWITFAALFLVPDVSMIGYLANPRAGALAYNLGHTYIAPSCLALAGCVLATPLLYSLALIWAAHIGFDRFIGYGLKFPVSFGATHLSWKPARHAAAARLP